MTLVEALNYVASPATDVETADAEALKTLSAEVNRLQSHVLICSRALNEENLRRYPRDTREGNTPDDGQTVIVWIESTGQWSVQEWQSRSRLGQVGHLWLPVPPDPDRI